ncbi:PHP-associated domain-containing protein [Pseudothermotoga sp.]|nr:phosphotransferase [Pseudothermotoga sp.]MCX7813083.1 phosphotransferase [Pseudothermotoga sp.]MDW8140485.1 PHP-associated domain-containing protein [Pseudothermotoga sp.]
MIKADLHVHSCLSPCAEITMVPTVVCSKAKEGNVQIFSITDHNSCDNLESFEKACESVLVPGIEVTSLEEVHVLGYFPTVESVKSFYGVFKKHLPKVRFDSEALGYQLLVNERDEFVAFEEDYLLVASNLGLSELIDLIMKFGGIAVYAHIDRQFGVLYQLGIFPQNDGVKLAEVRTKEGWKTALKAGYVPLTNSDAHRPDEIGCRFTRFDLNGASRRELLELLANPTRDRVLTIWD